MSQLLMVAGANGRLGATAATAVDLVSSLDLENVTALLHLGEAGCVLDLTDSL